jgi:hypothetical protein
LNVRLGDVMRASWADLEARVKGLAGYIWNRDAHPDRIGGVNIDCVIKIREDNFVLIEITEERALGKVRDDVTKLVTARGALYHTSQAYAQCFCVIGSRPTQAMVDAGKEQKVTVLSVDRLQQRFFDFESYKVARQRKHFGSAVNPITGEKDETAYTPVTYLRQDTDEDISITTIVDLLRGSKNVVMVGEYGSGKSRCVKELFSRLAETGADGILYPIAIDLRECWGLKRASEIIRRHFEDLG